MTVKQLIRKLNKLPNDAIITVDNYEIFISGEYEATSIEFDEDSNTVLIETDYEKKLW